MTYRSVCYIAGPMTGLPGFNYAAFDAARDYLSSIGWEVISPADLDRENLGIDFSVLDGTEDLSEYVEDFARQDLDALLRVHAVFVLEGWENSTGARNEVSIAGMIGVPVFSYETRELIPAESRFSNRPVSPSPEAEISPEIDEEDVLPTDPIERALGLVGLKPDPKKESRRRGMLEEAAELVDGDRNVSYGDPAADFRRTARLWSTYLDGKTELDPHDIAAMMALLKISRLRWSPEKRDSWVDLAGYAACGLDTIPEDWEK